MVKGVSPLIALVIVISLAVAAGALLAGWYTGLIKGMGGTVSEEAEKGIVCQWGGIRILVETIKCDLSGNATPANPEYLNFSVENSGSINLYNLRLSIFLQDQAWGPFEVVDLNNVSFTQDYPLRPDEIKTVKVNITQDLPLADPKWIKLLTNCAGVNSGEIPDVDCTP